MNKINFKYLKEKINSLKLNELTFLNKLELLLSEQNLSDLNLLFSKA